MTLEEIYQKKKKSFPFLVKHERFPECRPISVLARTSKGEFFCETARGESHVYKAALDGFELITNTIPHWPAVLAPGGGGVELSRTLYRSEEHAKVYNQNTFIRLATEYPPIMLEEK